MAVVRCPRGHYYDDQKFSACPYCGVPLTGGKAAPENGSKTGSVQPSDTGRTVPMGVSEQIRPYGDMTDHTLPLESLQKSPADDEKTITLHSGSKGNDYVTGWLVCVEGPEKGRDYRLHYGFNRLGRDFSMDIQVMDDKTITRDTHCSIVYDDHSNSFFAVPGAGTLTYMGDRLLDKATLLNAGDRLKMGESVFEFIPFCREGNVWEE